MPKPSSRTSVRRNAEKPASNAPDVKVDPRPKRRLGLSGRLKIAANVILGVLAILAIIPIILTFVYAQPGVRPVSTLMAAQWMSGEDIDRRWRDFDEISPFLWQSVMMSEDGQFCSHDGVDWNQVNIVINSAVKGENVRGASTLPMQLAKNLFLWPSRSYLRKALEVPLALLIDAVWTKRRIMEVYLNVAEWGDGIFGAEAAAQRHFGRSAARLNRGQAARLAVTLPNPRLRNPAKPSRGLQRLANRAERRGKASGAYIGCLR